MFKKKKAVLLLVVLIAFVTFGMRPIEAEAAKPVQISNCRLVSKTTVKVTAKLASTAKVYGKKCYLFALPLSANKLTKSDRPLQAKNKAKSMTFSVSLNRTKSTSRLYSKFVVAAKNKSGGYTIVSNLSYIANPQKAAKYSYQFPQAISKKGLQVSASMQEDAVELNVQHSVLNINFATMIASKGEQNKNQSIAYQYHGKTWWYRRSAIADYDRQLVALKETNALVSAILLLSWRDDLKSLIYPDGRTRGHAYYAWNTRSQAAREQLQAAISFLAGRYSPSNGSHGRIVNWIVGNEVNNYKVYNYAGEKSLNQYAAIYAQAFRMVYNTVTGVYANARVYISLDHLWNTNTVSGTFASRKMLDSFAAQIKRYGDADWNLAYHPYSCPLTEPKFWENANQQLTQALTSPVINMGNIKILTDYIKLTYGSNTRIILSEQGYTSEQNGKNVEKEQAAAIAYSYYLTESNDMIDSFIMNRHVDHDVEVNQGLSLGLWTTNNPNSPEWADEKKYAWDVFKYMDSNKTEEVASFALQEIGVDSWDGLIEDYSSTAYQKYSVTSGDLIQVNGYSKTAAVPDKWKKYGAATNVTKAEGGLRIIHNGTRNRNCLWGVNQTFKSGLNLKKNGDMLYTTLKITGASNGKAAVKIRIFSGKHIFECSSSILTGRYIALGVSLQNWAYADRISKIQLLIAPEGKGSWKANASLYLREVV